MVLEISAQCKINMICSGGPLTESIFTLGLFALALTLTLTLPRFSCFLPPIGLLSHFFTAVLMYTHLYS